MSRQLKSIPPRLATLAAWATDLGDVIGRAVSSTVDCGRGLSMCGRMTLTRSGR